MTLFIPDPPLNRQTPFMRILTALLILGALLFVILMVNNRNNKPPPFTTEITTCTGIVNGEVIAVTVEGTVRGTQETESDTAHRFCQQKNPRRCRAR